MKMYIVILIIAGNINFLVLNGALTVGSSGLLSLMSAAVNTAAHNLACQSILPSSALRQNYSIVSSINFKVWLPYSRSPTSAKITNAIPLLQWFWPMYVQVGDFLVSRGPPTVPLTQISCNIFFFEVPKST